MKKNRVLIISICLILLTAALFGGYKTARLALDKYRRLRDKVDQIAEHTQKDIRHYDFDQSWIGDDVLVAHAMGGKGSKTYTNSLEAFQYNYDLGHRVFEVDFDLTSDRVTVCSHDEDYWRFITKNEESGVEYSYENFRNTPLFTDYTPLDYKDIVDLLAEYEDIRIITDTKYNDELSVYTQFSQIVDHALEKDPSVLDRIIPQIYSKEMLDWVMNIYDFKSVIFTLYQISWEKEDIALFCKRSGVGMITVSSAFGEEPVEFWHSMGIKVAVHTLNDEEEAGSFLDAGADMIYTDYLGPDVFKKETGVEE